MWHYSSCFLLKLLPQVAQGYIQLQCLTPMWHGKSKFVLGLLPQTLHILGCPEEIDEWMIPWWFLMWLVVKSLPQMSHLTEPRHPPIPRVISTTPFIFSVSSVLTPDLIGYFTPVIQSVGSMIGPHSADPFVLERFKFLTFPAPTTWSWLVVTCSKFFMCGVHVFNECNPHTGQVRPQVLAAALFIVGL